MKINVKTPELGLQIKFDLHRSTRLGFRALDRRRTDIIPKKKTLVCLEKLKTEVFDQSHHFPYIA